jgi:hypothetical protein
LGEEEGEDRGVSGGVGHAARDAAGRQAAAAKAVVAEEAEQQQVRQVAEEEDGMLEEEGDEALLKRERKRLRRCLLYVLYWYKGTNTDSCGWCAGIVACMFAGIRYSKLLVLLVNKYKY